MEPILFNGFKTYSIRWQENYTDVWKHLLLRSSSLVVCKDLTRAQVSKQLKIFFYNDATIIHLLRILILRTFYFLLGGVQIQRMRMNLKTMLLVNYFQLRKHLHHYVFVATVAEGYMVPAHNKTQTTRIQFLGLMLKTFIYLLWPL